MVSQIAGKKTGKNVITLNVKGPDAYQKNTTGGVYFIFINVLYFSLITQNLEENSSKYFLCFF